ncbi:MAG: hypothetical protein DCC55_13415 [Chloroflexi bacterium]|nr:MAG: hypothetical protein DCC55_13415 [Chloroflexota bacterium]
MNGSPTLFALLIGIDNYDPAGRMRSLRGCVNDVQALEQVLKARYGVPVTNIRTLTNKQAKHQAIKRAFRDHLIGNAKKWKEAAGDQEPADPPPAFLFHFSGHGSQARDETGAEPDGFDETLVPYDSRTPGVYDIKDWELGQLIEELNRYSDNVTIILDCCHSGSGTRDIAETVAQTRRCPPDLRPQPKRRPVALRGPQTRSVGGANWEVGGKHVLLAGCRDLEESNEYSVRDMGASHWRGAMSYFMGLELLQMGLDRPLTYRELHERVRAQVNSRYRNQTPQCEGDIDRELFGGIRPQRDLFFAVVEQSGGFHWIDGGVAHGLAEGSQLKVYPPETRTLEGAGAPIATLEVVEEGAVRSGCQTVEAGVAVPLYARAVVHRINQGDMQRKVVLDIPDAGLHAAVSARLGPQAPVGHEDVSPYVQVVDEGAADFRVALRKERLEIQDSTGALLVAPFATDDLDGLAEDLAHLARYRNALNLRNAAPGSELAGKVTLAVKKLVFDPATQQPKMEEFPRAAEGGTVIETGERVVFEIGNHSDLPLYVALFDFGPKWEVEQLYPQIKGAHEPVQAGTTFSFGLSAKRNEQLEAFLADDLAEAKEIFKVIATVADTNFEVLEQGPLKSPFQTRSAARSADQPASALDQLLAQAMNGGKTRAYGPPRASVADEWTTAEVVVTTVRKTSDTERTLQGGTRTQLAAQAIAFEPPPGFAGKVRVLTATQSTRAAGGETTDLEPPPGLAALPDWFQPLPIGSTRSAGTPGALIEIDADDQARQAVTPLTPLDIHINWEPDADAAGALAIAYDGSFFYPVGRTEDDEQTVHVEWLPSLDEADVQPLRTTRDVGRTVKLYLYKLLKKEDPTLGLHQVQAVAAADLGAKPLQPGEQARPVPLGELRYGPVKGNQFKTNARVALVVHGFTDISTAIADWVANHLARNDVGYDHILAFDYESFNTRISENGRILADALRAAGFGPDDGRTLDVFAHSMGTLVARAMVELWGGNQFVDRCFLAGPPNQGTRLADVKRLIPWVSTLALNGSWASLPPAALAGWVLNKAVDDAVGPDDLRPASQFLSDLNLTTKPVTTPYFILAGRNDKPPQIDAAAWRRLQHKVMRLADATLDLIFGDQHDMVINVRSMLGIRNGHYPAELLKTRELACNHFEYFSNKQSHEQFVAWLKGE